MGENGRTCHNHRLWPVLVGKPVDRDAMLARRSSFTIIHDRGESPGHLFDSTEIDEILSLRIITLTDEENAMAAGLDERVRRLLERIEVDCQ